MASASAVPVAVAAARAPRPSRRRTTLSKLLRAGGLALSVLATACTAKTPPHPPPTPLSPVVADVHDEELARRIDALLPPIEEALTDYTHDQAYTDSFHIAVLPPGDFYDIAFLGSMQRRGFDVDSDWKHYYLDKFAMMNRTLALYDETSGTAYLVQPPRPWQPPPWYDFRPRVLLGEVTHWLRESHVLSPVPNDDTLARIIGHEWFHHWQANAHPEYWRRLDELIRKGWGKKLYVVEPGQDPRAKQEFREMMALIEGHAALFENEVLAKRFPSRQPPGKLSTTIQGLMAHFGYGRLGTIYSEGQRRLHGKSFAEIERAYRRH